MQVYKIPGEPIALARPRFSLSSKRVYNSQRNTMTAASIYLQSQHNTGKPYEGPLHLDIVFYFPIPKKTPKSKLSTFIYHHYRPDLSNCIKFIEDIAIGILYKDDAIIASISAKKVYDSNPRTEFTIQSL